MKTNEELRTAYSELYALYPTYRAPLRQLGIAWSCLREILPSNSLLDVGCGRGEFIRACRKFNIVERVEGVEIVPDLIEEGFISLIETAENLPFLPSEFEIVTCLDVMEHTIPGTETRIFRELLRVARYHVLLNIAHYQSSFKYQGEHLHINLHDRYWWLAALGEVSEKEGWAARLLGRVEDDRESWILYTSVV